MPQGALSVSGQPPNLRRMSDAALAIPTERRPRDLKPTGRVKRAIDAMVLEGLNRKAAAQLAGLTDHSLYVAFTKSHIKAYYNQQLEVLRTSERARNIHRAIEIRDAAPNMPAIHAIRYLDGEDAENARQLNAMHRAPGLTVVVVDASGGMRNPPPQVIDIAECNNSPQMVGEDEK